MITRMVAATSVSLLLLCAACGGNGATPADVNGAGADQVGDAVTGVQDVECSTHAVWPVPACAPSCSAGKFHVELPADDLYPPDPVLFLADGRTLVARSGHPDSTAGQVSLVMLSAHGTQEASTTIQPCGEPVPVELPDLDESGDGGFLLLATCSPGTQEQRTVLLSIDVELGVVEETTVIPGPIEDRFSVSLAVLDGTPYLLYVTDADENGPGTRSVRLVSNPGTEAAQTATLDDSFEWVGARPLLAEQGRLVILLVEGQPPGDKSGECSAVLVVDASGTVLARLDSERYGPTSGLDFKPKAAHVSGGELVVAGQSWDRVIGPDNWSSREAVIERRKLDGTLLQQTRIAMGQQTDFSNLLPLPPSSAGAAAAAWLVVLADRHWVKTEDGGGHLDFLPRFTWLTSDLEARFATLAPEGVPQVPGVLMPGCDCGYRMALNREGTLHVVRANNLLRFDSDSPCDDGLSCTSDVESDGICTLEVTAGCLGPDGCYVAGASGNNTPCLVCGQKAECGFLWQPLVDKAACGFDGQCMDGRCRCDGRWLTVKGSSKDMHKILAAGLQADGHVLAWTRATQVQTYPQGKLNGLDISANGDAVDLGSVTDSWFESTPLLVAEDATYAALDGKLKQMDHTGATTWSAPLPTWLPPAPDSAAYGIVQSVPDEVLTFYVGRKGQSLLAGATLYAEDGKTLASGSWTKSFAELEGEVEMARPHQQPEEQGIQALALPDGRIVILAGAFQVPDGSGIGLHHEFMVLVDKNGKDATLKVLPETHFAAAMAFGKDTFLSCLNLDVDEWTLEGEKKGSHDLADAVNGGKEVTRSCLGLVPGPDGGVRMLVRVWDKTTKAEYGEVLLLGLDWGLLETVQIPVVPASNGISTLPDGGFLVTGSLDSGVAAVLRGDADGYYRCW